jgi:hypothetical protein
MSDVAGNRARDINPIRYQRGVEFNGTGFTHPDSCRAARMKIELAGLLAPGENGRYRRISAV